MTGYEITFSITAVCPCCGNDLPSSSYLTVSRPAAGPLDRDNPYERKDRRVFITPCADCFEPKRQPDADGVRVGDVWAKQYDDGTWAACRGNEVITPPTYPTAEAAIAATGVKTPDGGQQ